MPKNIQELIDAVVAARNTLQYAISQVTGSTFISIIDLNATDEDLAASLLARATVIEEIANLTAIKAKLGPALKTLSSDEQILVEKYLKRLEI